MLMLVCSPMIKDRIYDPRHNYSDRLSFCYGPAFTEMYCIDYAMRQLPINYLIS